jgi:hypothetical protein
MKRIIPKNEIQTFFTFPDQRKKVNWFLKSTTTLGRLTSYSYNKFIVRIYKVRLPNNLATPTINELQIAI